MQYSSGMITGPVKRKSKLSSVTGTKAMDDDDNDDASTDEV